MAAENQSRVCIILVNWNGADDTIECLESLIRLSHRNCQIVVCDNDSSDLSVEKIQQWASGSYVPEFARGTITERLLHREKTAGMSIATVERSEAEEGPGTVRAQPHLLLIRTGANLGFAGANNVGMRYALNSNRFDYVWLVNNDTVVDADALTSMLNRIEQCAQPAICGSKILFYDEPTVIQALGGARYNRWTGISSTTLGRNLKDRDVIDHRDYEGKMSYIAGASCLVPVSFIKDVGLMSEDYFLYCEEIDWTLRASGRYDLVYAEDSRVYHKEGSSIGSPTGDRPSSLLSEFYIFRNKLKVVRAFNPWAIPVAYGAMLMQAFNRMRRGQWDKAMLILKIFFGKTRWQS
jgi:GT2 family glycosyltransferase